MDIKTTSAVTTTTVTFDPTDRLDRSMLVRSIIQMSRKTPHRSPLTELFAPLLAGEPFVMPTDRGEYIDADGDPWVLNSFGWFYDQTEHSPTSAAEYAPFLKVG